MSYVPGYFPLPLHMLSLFNVTAWKILITRYLKLFHQGICVVFVARGAGHKHHNSPPTTAVPREPSSFIHPIFGIL
jgi:hypothetical protein